MFTYLLQWRRASRRQPGGKTGGSENRTEVGVCSNMTSEIWLPGGPLGQLLTTSEVSVRIETVSTAVWGSVAGLKASDEVPLYVHRNRRLIRDGSPGRPPLRSHSSWALSSTKPWAHAAQNFSEPVWPSGKALGWSSGRTSVRYRFGSPFSSKCLWFVDTALWLCTSLPTETLKWLSS